MQAKPPPYRIAFAQPLSGLAYDALGRVTAKDVANAVVWEKDTVFAYDNLGRLTQAGDDVVSIAFGYDALGRKTSEANNIFGTTRSEYDLAGRRTRLTWRDGFFVTYDHLVTGETTTLRENGNFALATFAYDDQGRRTSLTRGNGTSTSYGYDPASRLSSLEQDAGRRPIFRGG